MKMESEDDQKCEYSQPLPEQALVFLRLCSIRLLKTLWAISPFSAVFSVRLENFLPFSSKLELSSVNSLTLEECKIYCLGKA